MKRCRAAAAPAAFRRSVILATTLLALLAAPALAQRGLRQIPMNRPNSVVGGVVNLPFMMNDNNGAQWRIYQNGWLQQVGNMPIYSQGASILVNGNQPAQNNNQARFDEKTGEVVLDNLNGNGFTVTRRILINKDEGYVRYIDIIKNTQGQDQTANVTIQTNLNYGVQNAQTVNDPKKKDHNIGWVAQTGAGPSAVEVFAGRGSKLTPTVNWPQGNNYVQANMALTIPAGKELAVMHLHATAATQDAGIQLMDKLKESQIMRSIAIEFRRLIVNFPSAQGFIGDVEVLRGELLDVIELRTGDQFKGTLKETVFDLQTFYGPVSVPVDKVVGIINVGQFRPRQLVVTADGQVFGGLLKKQTVDLLLSSGQLTQVPLSQVSRVGYRKRTGETEEWNFEGKSLVVMRSGERMIVQMPPTGVEVATRYGKLTLAPQAVAAVVLQNEESGVHEVRLTDGSRFAGLLTADTFTMKLDAGGDQTVKFPTSAMARIQLAGRVVDSDDTTPTLRLANEDLLVGKLVGELSLDTAFDTIGVSAAQIRSLTHAKESPLDIQVTLWDGTTLSGQLQGQQLACQLQSGVAMNVPVSLVEEYSQPQPQPSPSMIERIKLVIKDLNADDWKQRDRSKATLVTMGPVAIGVLKELRKDQPEEAQKAIDEVLKELSSQTRSPKAPSPPAPGPGVPGAVLNIDN